MKKFFIAIAIILVTSVSVADPVWIDVRTSEEHLANHISGDVRIAHEQIVTELEKLYPDKNTKLNLYCKSGKRAEKAQSALNKAGYINVSNAGGISDARKIRGLDR